MRPFLDDAIAEEETSVTPVKSYAAPARYPVDPRELSQLELDDISKLAADILFAQEISYWFKDIPRMEAMKSLKIESTNWTEK